MLGGALQLAVQIPALLKLGLLPSLTLGPSGVRQALGDTGTRRIAALMLPALLGVSVAQISLLINTQIASHLQVGSVSWLSFADRLMEFPTAMLGVALGVVLMPQLAAARAADEPDKYSAMLDWGLRLVLALGLPSAVALLLFTEPLVATLYHYGAFEARDVAMTTIALRGYGLGLLGLVAIKVLAPGFYANQDIKTPVKIAVAVLVITQLLNLVFVPWLAHAGLALSIGVGALLNALWLLLGLLQRGSYRPEAGWLRFAGQVVLASALLGLFLAACAHGWDWTAMRSQPWARLGLLAAVLAGSALIYFGTLRLAGLNFRRLLGR
jgi:putative peptidoglycan lipid II flippase